jgi:luciferase-like monooxygenase
MTTTSNTHALPPRSGDRPKTGPEIPHQQLSQNAPLPLQEELWQRMTRLEGVHPGRSYVSLPDTRALHLDPRLASGPRDAFFAGTEFAHLHGPSDGSLHLMLPVSVASDAIEKGWSELHPVARRGAAPPTLVMLYGPRDEAELETVWQLVQTSYAFARGEAA